MISRDEKSPIFAKKCRIFATDYYRDWQKCYFSQNLSVRLFSTYLHHFPSQFMNILCKKIKGNIFLAFFLWKSPMCPTIINFGIFSQGYFLIWWATFINLEVFIWGLPLFDVLDTKFITFCHIFCIFSSIIDRIFLTLSQNFNFLKK